ncbi:MAG TPA: chemotaxis protein CheX [bacterium]
MRYEYIEPFMKSTIEVISKTIQSEISKGDIVLIEHNEINDDVAIVIKIAGDSEGGIILTMDTVTAIKISNRILKENFEMLTPLCLDSLAEIANTITGNAISLINDMGYDIRTNPPLILVKDNGVKNIFNVEIFCVPIFTRDGDITMNIALRTN